MKQDELLRRLDSLLTDVPGYQGYGAPDGRPVLYFASVLQLSNFINDNIDTPLVRELDALRVRADIIGEVLPQKEGPFSKSLPQFAGSPNEPRSRIIATRRGPPAQPVN
jgi:hypothetical protein